MNDYTYEVLKKTTFFSSLPDSALIILAKGSTFKKFRKDDIIIPEGEFPGGIYILLSGEATIFSANNQAGVEKIISKLETHGIIGELSVINNDRAIVSVRASKDIECLFIDGNVFRELLKTHAEISQKLLPMVVNRLHQLFDIFMQ